MNDNNKRRRCQRCSRPESVCLCAHIKPTYNRIAVSIYRHSSEVKKAVGTAALAALCLKHCSIIDGDVVSLASPGPRQQRLLLFPPMESASLGLADGGLIDAASVSDYYDLDELELIVIDGSWKKARKMYYQSADLQSLSKVVLAMDKQQARYTIRKAEKPGQFSTLEAIAAALSQIENNSDKYQSLLALQQAMVAKQLASMNESVQRRYR
jgi:DTW domain-containing protein YfiP